jgi:transposase
MLLADLLEDDLGEGLPEAVRAMLRIMLEHIDQRVTQLDKEIARRAREDEITRRLMTIPGIGPITATAIAALAPAAETFRCGRDFAAWLGLTPLRRSTGGKTRLGRTEDRRAHVAAPDDHRRQRGGASCQQAGGAGWLVA